MNGVLDHLFNNIIYLFIFCGLLAFAFYCSGKIFLKKREGTTPAWLQVAAFCIGIVGPIALGASNQLVCGFGFSDALTPVGRRGDLLLLQSVLESEDSSLYRLYGVDLATGKRLFRRNFRNRNLNGKLEAWNGDRVWFNPTKGLLHARSREIIALSAATGETLITLNTGDLAKRAGLKAEIAKIESVTGDDTVIVQTKDGLWVEIDPVKYAAVREQDIPITPVNPAADFRVETAQCSSSVRVKDTVWRLEGGPRMRLMFDETTGDRAEVATGAVFISGCLMSRLLDGERVPVLSWEDIDKKNFLLDMFSADGSALWRLEGRKLGELGIPIGTPSWIRGDRAGIVLLQGGHMVSINSNNGTVSWHLRL